MTIRDADTADAAAIARLTTLLGYAADADAIARRLARITRQEEHLVIVALVKEEVVGWLQAHASVVLESGFRVEIVGLIVGEESRRGGVGRGLVQRAERWAREIGAESVVVRSNTKRVESHLFYPALGFTSAKTQAVYRRILQPEPNPSAQPAPGMRPAGSEL